MRILWLNYFDGSHPRAGGAEIHLHEMARCLVAGGHEIVVAACGWPGAAPSGEVDGIAVRRAGRWWNAHVSVPRLARRLLRESLFDVLVDGVNKIPFFSPKWSSVPVVALFMHLVGDTAHLDLNPVLARLFLRQESRLSRFYSGVRAVAISRSTASELAAAGLSSDAIRVIECGLDLDLYRPGLEKPPSAPRVLVISRLRRYKRVDLAVEAMVHVRRIIPDAHLEVLGGGDQLDGLKELARARRVPAVFRGHVPQGDKVRALQGASVLVAPSEKEGWGLTCVEAMACGTPVVATGVPGHRDSVTPGAGLLVESTPAAVADGVLSAIGNADLIRGGLDRVRSLSWEAAARRFEEVLREARAPATSPGHE